VPDGAAGTATASRPPATMGGLSGDVQGADIFAPETTRVLLIEDDELFVELTQLILAERGFEEDHQLVAGSMAEACDLLCAHAIDLILADLTLPDAYGLEVVRRCLELKPDIPIIVLTACRDLELALEALAKGAQDYLVKGEFDDDGLVRAIRYAFARSRAEAELRSTLHDLEESNRQLEESNNQLEQYATIASHDLRSPVRTARVLAGRLIASAAVQSDPKSLQMGASLDDLLARLEVMLQGLLDYAQARDLSSSGEREQEAISAVVDEIEADLGADLSEAAVTIERDGDATIRCHPTLVRSLFLNLIRNAIKYRSERPLRIVVAVETVADTGRVLVKVLDNGSGIEPKFRTRVFGMFERLSGFGDGIGLGLTLCHRVVSLHGGRIWIEDGLDGEGVAVCFTLPAAS
jgi:signal transduction histidine kinase